MKLTSMLAISDVHAPFHDKRAVETVLKVARDLRPGILIINGDFADFLSVSGHRKDPNEERDLKRELGGCNAVLDAIDAAVGKCIKVFVGGNHEDRLPRYLADNAPALANMLQIGELLQLEKRGYAYTPYKDWTKIGKLHVTHESGRSGKHAHLATLAYFQGNVIQGHTHRIAVAYSGNARGDKHVCAMFGHLADEKKIGYAYKAQMRADWQHGFGVGYFEPNGNVHLQAIPIVNYRCVVNGTLYTA